ncbi:hypothetical protein [Puerhibacterium puerhi]|uniref:hypothetical protein n=1 Tax=Puerhibacterium puerhi TaxID=2692623 RepID=UPI0013588C1E|nr:hypothetical protein [Puerhibacterium puerhi]
MATLDLRTSLPVALTRMELHAAHYAAAGTLAEAIDDARALVADLEHETAAYMRARLGIDPDSGTLITTEDDVLATAAAHLSAGTDLGVRLAAATLRGYLDRPGVAARYAPVDLDVIVATFDAFARAFRRVTTAAAAGINAFAAAWNAAMASEKEDA